MVSQSIYVDNQPNANIQPAVWWDEIRFHADRFFDLAHTFDRKASVRIQAALMANLIDQQEIVESMPYPPSVQTARNRLLDAMAHTLIGINTYLNADNVNHVGFNAFATARTQLACFHDALSSALATQKQAIR